MNNRRPVFDSCYQVFNHSCSLQTDPIMLDNDYAIPAIVSLVTALLIGGLYLFTTFFRDGEDE